MKPCKDCVAQGITTKREAKWPGPRCTTHWRAEKKRRSAQAHGVHVEKVYGITAEDYQRLYLLQGERCAICGVATGKRKRLAVDHDHETGEVRGLLCGKCNFDLLGRYNEAALLRAVEYLRNPPARRLM